PHIFPTRSAADDHVADGIDAVGDAVVAQDAGGEFNDALLAKRRRGLAQQLEQQRELAVIHAAQYIRAAGSDRARYSTLRKIVVRSPVWDEALCRIARLTSEAWPNTLPRSVHSPRRTVAVVCNS